MDCCLHIVWTLNIIAAHVELFNAVRYAEIELHQTRYGIASSSDWTIEFAANLIAYRI